jgi:hypothetical protein
VKLAQVVTQSMAPMMALKRRRRNQIMGFRKVASSE